jgi:hypothetical protein
MNMAPERKERDPKAKKTTLSTKGKSKAGISETHKVVEVQGKQGQEPEGKEKNASEDRIGHPKKRAMLQALAKTLGNVKQACLMMEKNGTPLERQTHYNWLKADPNYKKAVDDIAEQALDFVEGKLAELINGVGRVYVTSKGEEVMYTDPPNVTAVMFYLNNRGGRREYGNRIEVKHTGGKVLDPELPEETPDGQ